MRFNKIIWVAVLALMGAKAQAAVKPFEVQYQQAVVDAGRWSHETKLQNYAFRVEILSDDEGVKDESSKHGRPYVTAVKGERYSVRLYNPLPVRVAVNLTVDGLNAITGKPSSIEDGQKWMIEPYSSITIPGWQVSNGEARRFFFTDKPKSYAKWRGDKTFQDLAANCGVIGAAYFWNQGELNQYYDSHPIYRNVESSRSFGVDSNVASDFSLSREACVPLAPVERAKKVEPQEQAGTGMGESESHPTHQVSFEYDKGMYSVSQAVVIYYDFEKSATPNPFPNSDYAPEMSNQ